MDLLKATSARLAAAKSMSFTATVGYEFPSKLGPPIVYTVRYDVTMQRPDKLKIVMPGDGPASEFYYDGKTMMAYAPAENLVAVADAPPTIDAALKAAYNNAAIFFPFTDLLVADPYVALTDGAILAFYIGPSERGRWHEDGHGGVGQQGRVPADLDRRRRQAAAAGSRGLCRRPVAAAQRARTLELAARCDDRRRRVHVARRRWPRRALPSKSPTSTLPSGHQAAGQDDAATGGRSRSRSPPDRRSAMKTIVTVTAALIAGAVALGSGPAAGWASANRAGGSTSH